MHQILICVRTFRCIGTNNMGSDVGKIKLCTHTTGTTDNGRKNKVGSYVNGCGSSVNHIRNNITSMTRNINKNKTREGKATQKV